MSLLVAGGLTNGAVARRLYLSPRTVNTHLRQVFAKTATPCLIERAVCGRCEAQPMRSASETMIPSGPRT
jgi:DNA-binding NarL/FixJ family response regulator